MCDMMGFIISLCRMQPTLLGKWFATVVVKPTLLEGGPCPKGSAKVTLREGWPSWAHS